jgi:TatD DNase family protein
VIDSHAHYDDSRFDSDRDKVLQDCVEHGVTHIINAGSNVTSSKKSIELTQKYSFIYASVGIHPHDVAEAEDDAIDKLITLSKEEKVVAIGEIGLDYHYDFSPREVQREWFARQIALARKLKLPIIIHDREAHKDILDIIKSENAREVGGVFHCFSGSKEMAREVLDLGFSIGIGGALTFKNAKKPVEVVDYVPLDMLLVETDCPYMSPEPFRGKRNWSGLIKYVLEKISEIKKIDYFLAESQTGANAIDLFKL